MDEQLVVALVFWCIPCIPLILVYLYVVVGGWVGDLLRDWAEEYEAMENVRRFVNSSRTGRSQP